MGIERELLLRGVEQKFVKKYLDVMVEFAMAFGAENRTLVEDEMLKALEFEIRLAKVSGSAFIERDSLERPAQTFPFFMISDRGWSNGTQRGRSDRYK